MRRLGFFTAVIHTHVVSVVTNDHAHLEIFLGDSLGS